METCDRAGPEGVEQPGEIGGPSLRRGFARPRPKLVLRVTETALLISQGVELITAVAAGKFGVRPPQSLPREKHEELPWAIRKVALVGLLTLGVTGLAEARPAPLLGQLPPGAQAVGFPVGVSGNSSSSSPFWCKNGTKTIQPILFVNLDRAAFAAICSKPLAAEAGTAL